MARANLSAMLGRLEDESLPTAKTPPEPKTAATTPRESSTKPRVTPASPTKTAKKTIATELETLAGPRYSRLDRKETRLRPDQYEGLTEHARRLNRAKGTGGERITENTLIRIAIDMLLARATELDGKTEEELRNSVSS